MTKEFKSYYEMEGWTLHCPKYGLYIAKKNKKLELIGIASIADIAMFVSKNEAEKFRKKIRDDCYEPHDDSTTNEFWLDRTDPKNWEVKETMFRIDVK